MKTVTIRAASSELTEVLLYDQIGRDAFFGDGISAKEFREQLRSIKTPRINLRINSPGGSVFEGSAMLAALEEHPSTIRVDVDGLAASAASLIMMAGDEIHVASNAMVMIHNPHALAIGDAAEMLRMAELLEKSKEQFVATYAKRTGASRKQISDWMDAETWFTGEEAVEAGFADSAGAPVSVAAFADALKLVARLGAKKVPETPSGPRTLSGFLRHITDDAQRALQETERRKAIAARL